MTKVKNDPEVTEEEGTQEKPATKKSTAKKEPAKKENIFKRGWNCIKRNRKYIATAAGGVVVGAAGTYGVGKWQETRANKRSAQYNQDCNND